MVNLRLETEPVTEFVVFDAQRIRRVLARIAADLDAVVHSSVEHRSSGASTGATAEAESEDALAQHRRRLAANPLETKGSRYLSV